MATNTPHLVADGETAARVRRVLEEEGRTYTWLSRSSGIPLSTLRFQLRTRPERLTVKNLLSIATALDRPVESILTMEEAA